MKHSLTVPVLLLILCLSMTACLGSDDDNQVTTYGDMAITSFTLGTIPRYTTSTSTTTGNDTTIRTTISGSAYPMTIDHLGCRIYNASPLPMGTDVKHVVCTVTAKNGGSVALQSMTSDSLQWYNSSDSIDFSVPRIFRVYAINGEGYRDYTVTVNVSETTGTTFDWKKERVGTIDAPANYFTDVKLYAMGDKLVLMSKQPGASSEVDDGDWIVQMSADGQQWNSLFHIADDGKGIWCGATVKDGLLYYQLGTTLNKTGESVGWERVLVDNSSPVKRLVGSSSTELFALDADGQLMRSVDDGLTWQAEQLDDSADLLPTENIATVTWSYGPADNTDYVLMVGNSRQEDDAMSIWRKISEQGKQGQWVYMPVDDYNLYTLPRMNNLAMTCYDDKVLAVSRGLKMFESSDQGVSWQVSTLYALPTAFVGDMVAMVADNEGRLWLVSNNGDVWRGQKY